MTHRYTLLVGGTVIPGGDEPDAAAIAWAEDTVIALGAELDVRAISRGDSHLFDLGGAFVVPIAPEGDAKWPVAATLEVGERADLAVLDRDPRMARADDGRDPRPRTVAIVRGGRVLAGALPGGSTNRHEHDPSEPAFDVEGPVQAEVFVVWLAGDHLELTGPCGPAPWIIELGVTDHPVEVVTRIVRDAIGRPLLVHSTSWRRDRDALILSFVAVIDAALVGPMASAPIGRIDLARGEASAAPRAVATDQVVEHGLRHLAWLAQDDPVVAHELPAAWHLALAEYMPEPFRNLG